MLIDFKDLGKILGDAEKVDTEKDIVPTIAIAGRTGAGKSTLLNALAGKFVSEVGVIPTTQEPVSHELDEDGTLLRIIDFPGVGEANKFEQRLDTLLEQLPSAHLLLLATPCPERSFQYELSLMDAIREQFGKFPIPTIVAGTKIDLASPVKDWHPAGLDLGKPSTEKEKNITAWTSYARETLAQEHGTAFIPCSAGEDWRAVDEQYGIAELRAAIYEKLPAAAQLYFARVDAALRDREAAKIIQKYALMAAAAAAQPMPQIPDAALILPIQVMMIIRLTRLHGREMSQDLASKFIGPILAQRAGQFLFGQLAKLIPGVGSVLGAAIAGGLTYSLGNAFHILLHDGNWDFNADDLMELVKSIWEKEGSRMKF